MPVKAVDAPKGVITSNDVVTVAEDAVKTVESAVKDAAPETVAAVAEVATGKETVTQAVSTVATDVASTVESAVKSDVAATPVVAEVTKDLTDAAAGNLGADVEPAIEHEEAGLLERGAEWLEDRVPAWARPIIEEFLPEVETVIYGVTNVITTDFGHTAKKYIVELEAAAVKGLHETQVKALIEAKILEEDGIRLVSNAINILDLTGAKAIAHHS